MLHKNAQTVCVRKDANLWDPKFPKRLRIRWRNKLQLYDAKCTCGSKFRSTKYRCNIPTTSSHFASNNSKLETIYKAIQKIPIRRQAANIEVPVIQKSTQDTEVNQEIRKCDLSYQHVLYPE